MAYINFKDIDHSDVVIRDDISGVLENYLCDGIRCDSFLRSLVAKGLLPTQNSGPDNYPKPLETIRELYEICRANAPDTPVFQDATAGQLLACRENAAENSERFEGYKLLELRYYECEPEAQVITFKYPYTEVKQYACSYDLRIFISNPNLYNTVIRMLYEYDRPILVYAYWRPVGRELLGSVDGCAQIDRL